MAKKSLIDTIRALTLGAIIGFGIGEGVNQIIEYSWTKNHTYQSVSEDNIQSVLWPQEQEKQINFAGLDYKEAIKKVQTPSQVQWNFLENYFNYDKKEKSGKSFKEDYTKRKGVCLNYAVCAAALLSDNGYPPLVLLMRNQKEKTSHAVFLFKDKKTEWFCALGNTPLFSEANGVNGLVKTFYSEKRWDFEEYAIINLDNKFSNHEWIAGNVDLQRMIIDKWTKVNN